MADNQGTQYSILDLLNDTQADALESEGTDARKTIEFDFNSIFNDKNAVLEKTHQTSTKEEWRKRCHMRSFWSN